MMGRSLQDWQNWYRSAALRNVVKLTSGTVIAQVLPILFFPVLSRLYSPVDYGVLGLFMGISMLLVIVANMQLNFAVLMPKEDCEALRIVVAGVQWVAVFAALLAVFALLAASWVAQWLAAPELNPWLYLLPVTVLLSGVSTQVSAWFNRVAQFGALSVSRIVASLVTVVCSLGFYFFWPGPAGLVLSYTLGSLATCVYLLVRFGQAHSLTPLSFEHMKQVVRQYKNFPLYTLPTELIGNFAQQLPLFIFSSFLGPQSAGWFSRSRQMLGLPITYIGSSVAEVYKQKASEVLRTNPLALTPLFYKTLGGLVAVSVVPFGLATVFSPQLFAFFFGEPWRQAGVFTQYLVIMYFFKFIVSPVTFNFVLAGRQRDDLLLHLLILVVTSFALFAGLKWKSSSTGLLLFSVAYAVMYLIYAVKSYQFSLKLTSNG